MLTCYSTKSDLVLYLHFWAGLVIEFAHMITVLLAVIAGILSVQFLDNVSRREDSMSLVLDIPVVAIVVIIATIVILGVAWGMDSLLQLTGFYLD